MRLSHPNPGDTVSFACFLRCFGVTNDMPLGIAGAIGFGSSACSVCFGSSLYNGPSSGVSFGFASSVSFGFVSSVCFGFARRFLRS